MKRIAVFMAAILIHTLSNAQPGKHRIVDAVTSEPVQGASIQCDSNCASTCISDSKGEFVMSCTCTSFTITCMGYQSQQFSGTGNSIIMLSPSVSMMNEVVVTASRGETIRRSLAPVAVAGISPRTIQETRAISADQLLNKISGVNMVSLGNEQHQMSIRQPITTKSLFLYLEDGIPVRTTGIFNHNALLEMNMAASKNIEVIKGPSSSLYGSEAIGGVVNFITMAPSSIPVLKISTQANQLGYRRVELQSGFSKGKWGYALSGYHALKQGGHMEYTNFSKTAVTARVDHNFNNNSQLSNSITYINYYSDMPGNIDSAMFAGRKFINRQSFTYRKVEALRARSTFTHSWSSRGKTTASMVFRKNAIGQNPAYRIRDDYRRVNGSWTGKKDLAHGEINENSFSSLALIAQHKQNFSWKESAITAGISADLSPSGYESEYISIRKDTVTGKYTAYQVKDSTLSRYNTRISNYAAYAGFEFSATEKLRIVSSLRFDVFNYKFNNHLLPSSFTGSKDTLNSFSRLSSKIGFTYNFSKTTGLYANYSQGFVPPQITEMYNGVKVPDLKPAIFHNYEIGGWASFLSGKITLDASLYQLNGNNEVVSVKMDDGSTENRNAGETSHKGIEAGLQLRPFHSLNIRFSGAYSEHRFVKFNEKGNNYDGKEMNGAPRWIHNIEAWYKPQFLKGLRLGLEWQMNGAYYMDPANTEKYKGYDLVHLRAGYRFRSVDLWLNVMNAADSYYATLATKTPSAKNYQLAEPRSFQFGMSVDLGKLFNQRP